LFLAVGEFELRLCAGCLQFICTSSFLWSTYFENRGLFFFWFFTVPLYWGYIVRLTKVPQYIIVQFTPSIILLFPAFPTS
jgi:hypothetical protein